VKAVLISQFGPPEVLKIGEIPDLSITHPEGVIIRVKAAGLNNADLLQRMGRYPPPVGASEILGMEVAGEILKTGSGVNEFRHGDRVMALLPGGGYAEQAKILEAQLMPIPRRLSFEEAAAIPEAFLTSFLELIELAKIKKNENILIHAGASGVGTAAIQIARCIGTRIFATASSEEKLEVCKELGAEVLINYRKNDFVEKVLEATNQKGVDCILDLVGAVHFHRNIEALSLGGRLLLVGLSGGAVVEKMDLHKILSKRIQIIGSTLRARSDSEKTALVRKFCEFALPLFESGQLKPIVDRVFEFSHVVEAHRYLESRQNKGKVILRIP